MYSNHAARPRGAASQAPAHRPTVGRPRHRPAPAPGFTLIELLVTLAIVTVVGAIGAPMLKSFIDETAVSTQSDVLIDSLNYTRSEAVTRNERVTMCRSTDGSTCAVGTGVGDWTVGWLVFVDKSNAAVIDSGDEILRVQSALPKGKISGLAGIKNYVSYNSEGQPRMADDSPQFGHFFACASEKQKRRKITIRQGTGSLNVKQVGGNPQCDANN